MTTHVSEALLADIMSVSKAIAARWRQSGKITPDSSGMYDLTAHGHLPQVRKMFTPPPPVQKPRRTYRAIELFAGAGGLSLGLEKAGFESQALYELDSHACATLRQNRPKWQVIEGDVTEADFSEHRGIDLLAGGFPCQAFSYSGNKLGFSDTRGTLFYEFARAIQETQPKVFIGENVRGLLTHDKKRTISTIKQVLTGLGYTLLEPTVLKAMFYRVPQKRERLFLVGIRNDLPAAFRWPSPHHRVYTLRDALKAGELYPTDCPTSPGQQYSAKTKSILAQVPPGGCWQDLPEHIWRPYLGSATPEKVKGGQRSVARRLDWETPSLTLTCKPIQKQTQRCHPDETRPLTVREYARIQTFPDDWVFSGPMGAQYKQIGNAVPPNLAQAMGHRLIALLNGIENVRTREQ
jgi:DNA (cytosine-5)-methyltransferase 1